MAEVQQAGTGSSGSGSVGAGQPAIVEAAAKLSPSHVVALSFAAIVLDALVEEGEQPEYLRFLLQDLLHALELLRKRPTADASSFLKTFLHDDNKASRDVANAIIDSMANIRNLQTLDAMLDENERFLRSGNQRFCVHEHSELGLFLSNLHVSRQQCGFTAMSALQSGIAPMLNALRAFVESGFAAAEKRLAAARMELRSVFQRVLSDQFVELLDGVVDRTPLTPPGGQHHMRSFISALQRGDPLSAQEHLLLHFEVERNRDWVATQNAHSESQLALAHLHRAFSHEALAQRAVHDAVGTALELGQEARLRQALTWLAETAPTTAAAAELSRANLKQSFDTDNANAEEVGSYHDAMFAAHVQLAVCSFASGAAPITCTRSVQAAMGVALSGQTSWHSYTCALHLMGAFSAATGASSAVAQLQAAVVFSATPPPEHAHAPALSQAQLALVLARKHGRYSFASSFLSALEERELRAALSTDAAADANTNGDEEEEEGGGDDDDDDDGYGGGERQDGTWTDDPATVRCAENGDDRERTASAEKRCARVRFYRHLALHWQHTLRCHWREARACEAALVLYAEDTCDHLVYMLRAAERAYAEGHMDECLQRCNAIEKMNETAASHRPEQAHKLQGPIVQVEVLTLRARCLLHIGDTEQSMSVLARAAAVAAPRGLIGPLAHIQIVFLQCLVETKRWSVFAAMEETVAFHARVYGSFEAHAELLLLRAYVALSHRKDAAGAHRLLQRSYAMHLRLRHTRNLRRCLHLLALCAHSQGNTKARDSFAQQLDDMRAH